MNRNLRLSFRSDLDLSGIKQYLHELNSHMHFRCVHNYLCEGKICPIYKCIYGLFLHAYAFVKVHIYKA